MKIIRWWGLAAFAVIVIILACLWYLFAPSLVKNSIVNIGTEALGAKVEVSDVELSLFPVSVLIKGLVATDPEQPMQNIFDSQEIKFSVDAGALLWKKIIIDEVIVSGVKTGTQRISSGELVGGRKSSQAIQNAIDVVIPDVNNIDINALVAKADLVTLQRIQELKINQAKIKQEWQSALDKEAFGKRIADIQAEYNRLADRAKQSKFNLIKDAKDWKKLKASIDTERKQIASLSNKLKQDKNTLSTQLSSVKNGPNDDLKAIMDNLGVGNGVDGLVDKYLGPQYTPWVKKILAIVKGIKPAEGSEAEEVVSTVQVGKKIYFTDQHIFPELLIKKIKLSGSNQGWELDGKGFDLGYLPWLTGKPAKLNIDFGGKGAAKLNLTSDWPSATKMLTKLNATVTSWPLKSMQLMQTSGGSWLLNSGNLTAQVNGEVTLETINLNLSFSISSPELTPPENIKNWQKSLANSINQQSKIDFKLTATGSIDSPKIKIDSSLEGLFKQAIGDKMKAEANKLTGKVKQKITEKMGDISALENFGGNFEQWQSNMSSNDQILKDLLSKLKI